MMEGHTSLTFPQEIWWLVAQELTRKSDFAGLFLCARLGRGFARLALPELYAIHDQSPAINAHIHDIETSVCLWRSIIASSMGKTLFPYCCWIKTLRLGNLHSQLEDLARDNPGPKAQFFSPPLEKLQIWRRGRTLNLEAIVIEVANLVTDCIRNSADKEDKRIGITALEGYYLPTANLPTWVSGLYSLTSLAVRDGSVLNSDVARAIRANCPAFREVKCFFCTGTDLDEEMAGFFRNLEPSSLESFTVMSVNQIGEKTLKALCEHSRSLKTLGLLSLERTAFSSLNELRDCLSLESFRLEAAPSARHYPWETDCKQVFEEVVQWLQNCTALRGLSFTLVPNSVSILAEILKSPLIRLDTLGLQTLDDLGDKFFAALRHQQGLRHLAVKVTDEDLLEAAGDRQLMFAHALACCQELRELDTNELFSFEAIEHICNSLPLLEDVVLNGDLIDDVFFTPISRLSKLKSLNIYGPSILSPGALLELLDRFAEDPAGEHGGLHVYVANQNYDFKFTENEEVKVATAFCEQFRGIFDITYRQDPDELHESDFSD